MLSYIEKLDAEADELVMTTMISEYSYLLQVGALFLILRPKWRFLSILQLVLYILIPLYFMYCSIKTTPAWGDDLNNVATTVHYTTLLIITIIISLSFIYYRRRLIDLMRITGNNYYTYKDGFQSSKEEVWRKEARKRKIILLIAIPAYFFMCVIVGLVIVPYLDGNKRSSSATGDYINTIYMKAPVPIVNPYVVNSKARHYFTVLLQMVGGTIVSFVVAGADLALIFLSQGVALQMNILRDAIENIDKRALKVYNELYEGNANKKIEELYDDERFLKLINLCIKENVQHHKVISKAFDHISEIGKWPLGAAFFCVSAAIAFALFSFISSGRSQILTQILSLMLLSAEVWNMLIISLIGQQLTDMSEGITNALYELKWRYWNKSCKLSMLIFKERLKRPLVIMAGGLTPINMEMFSTVMNSSYSYFNLIYAVYSDNGSS